MAWPRRPVPDAPDRPGRGTALLHARPRRPPHRGRPADQPARAASLKPPRGSADGPMLGCPGDPGHPSPFLPAPCNDPTSATGRHGTVCGYHGCMPTEPKTGRGRASRERIVERAAELFAERGIAATSVDEVLAAAGAGKGQFYHYFRGRDELAAEAGGDRRGQVVAGLQAAAGFDAWEQLLAGALERMRQQGELRAGARPGVLATGLLASIEGG